MMTAHFPGSMHTFLETPYLPRSDSLAFHDWPSTPAITNPPTHCYDYLCHCLVHMAGHVSLKTFIPWGFAMTVSSVWNTLISITVFQNFMPPLRLTSASTHCVK